VGERLLQEVKVNVQHATDNTTSKMWLRIGGDLPPTQELVDRLGTKADSVSRKGETSLGGRIRQSVDVWLLYLTDRWYGAMSATIQTQVAATLHRLAPALCALDPTRSQTEVNVSTNLYNAWWTTLHLSSEVVGALAAGRLTFGVDITLIDLEESSDSSIDSQGEGAPDIPDQPSAAITVRLWGATPSLDELTEILGGQIEVTALPRTRQSGSDGDQQSPGWEIPLTENVHWDEGGFLARANWTEAARTLEQLTPGLQALRQAGCITELHIKFTCSHFSDGFSLPSPLVVAAGTAGLEFDLLVLRADEASDSDDAPSEQIDLDDPELITEVQHAIDESASKWWTQ
jgi:hypothetical protein